MTLSARLIRIEKNQKIIQDELAAIRQEAMALEEENHRLRRQICQVGDADIDQVSANALRIQQSAQSNLEMLYKEGFHICHLFFGKKRNGECLFCRGFLDR